MDISVDNFMPKIEANYDDPSTKTTQLALVVHGVDFMNTRKVGSMFNIVGEDPRTFVHKIIWLDDSNCLVVFMSPQKTQLALQRLLLDPQKYKVKVE
jgi:hypothetical protein